MQSLRVIPVLNSLIPCRDQKAGDSTWNARASVSPFLFGFERRGEKYWEKCHKRSFISSSDLLRNKRGAERQSASSKPNHQGSPQISVCWINCLDDAHGTYNGETTLGELQPMSKKAHVVLLLSQLLFGQWCSPCDHRSLFCFWLMVWVNPASSDAESDRPKQLWNLTTVLC